MKLLLIFSLSLLYNSTSAQSFEDSIAVVELLKNDYITMAENDFPGHKRNCTSDYLLIENGEIMTLSDEKELYNKIANMRLQRTDQFSFLKVKITGNTAYAVYRLNSFFKNENVEFERYWSETAFFRKEKGSWKIAVIHSTPLKLTK